MISHQVIVIRHKMVLGDGTSEDNIRYGLSSNINWSLGVITLPPQLNHVVSVIFICSTCP